MHVLPPNGMTSAGFDKALADFRRVLGDQWVLSGDEDRQTYIDPYALGDGLDHDCSAILAPSTVEEVQAILRLSLIHI